MDSIRDADISGQSCIQKVIAALGHFTRYFGGIDEGITPVNPDRISSESSIS